MRGRETIDQKEGVGESADGCGWRVFVGDASLPGTKSFGLEMVSDAGERDPRPNQLRMSCAAPEVVEYLGAF